MHLNYKTSMHNYIQQCAYNHTYLVTLIFEYDNKIQIRSPQIYGARDTNNFPV